MQAEQIGRRATAVEPPKDTTVRILEEVQKLKDLADSKTEPSELRFRIRRTARHIERIVRSA